MFGPKQGQPGRPTLEELYAAMPSKRTIAVSRYSPVSDEVEVIEVQCHQVESDPAGSLILRSYAIDDVRVVAFDMVTRAFAQWIEYADITPVTPRRSLLSVN